MQRLITAYLRFFQVLRQVDGLPLLCIRLILAPTMIIAGYHKLNLGDAEMSWFARLGPNADVVAWFGNSEWGLGLPWPELMVSLAGWSEFLGGWLLLAGLATRLVSVPLIITMIVAASTAHWHNGWFAVAPGDPDTSPAQVLAWLGVSGAEASLQNSIEVSARLLRVNNILQEHGNYAWLTAKGDVVVHNNGIEFAALYLVMLLVLLFNGGGRYVSLDYWWLSWRDSRIKQGR